jgi:hypothetical protein
MRNNVEEGCKRERVEVKFKEPSNDISVEERR